MPHGRSIAGNAASIPLDSGEARPDKPVQPGWRIDPFESESGFSTPELRVGEMNVATTRQQLLDGMELHSYLSVRSPEARRPVLDEVATLVADFPEPFDVPYRTEAYRCRKLPQQPS